MATTLLVASMVTWQAPLPAQAPTHPLKVDPAAAVGRQGDDRSAVVRLGAVGAAVDAGGRGRDRAGSRPRLRHGQGVHGSGRRWR